MVAAGKQKDGVIEVLDDIEAAAIQGGRQDPKPEVLVLGRYRNGESDLPARNEHALQIEFSTVHSAKGREADYGVVLMGGFPSRKQDDAILAMVLPPAKEEVAFGEERRLFYVATTRAKRGLYLIVDDRRPAPFVWELLESGGRLSQTRFIRAGCSASMPELLWRTHSVNQREEPPLHEPSDLPPPCATVQCLQQWLPAP